MAEVTGKQQHAFKMVVEFVEPEPHGMRDLKWSGAKIIERGMRQGHDFAVVEIADMADFRRHFSSTPSGTHARFMLGSANAYFYSKSKQHNR